MNPKELRPRSGNKSHNNFKSHTNRAPRTNYKTLFEQQSYRDALDFYLSTLSAPSVPTGEIVSTGASVEEPVCVSGASTSVHVVPTWDYVILTASNEAQAKAYRIQIEHRLSENQLPRSTHYAVIPDLNGQRVGSGGATISCVKYVMEREGTFKDKKVLVIHSGGDSKRIPQYSARGKLFSPVPRLLPDGNRTAGNGSISWNGSIDGPATGSGPAVGTRRSTLFDEFMIGMSTVASRISEGMLVCSGDVLLLFNALQIDFYSRVHGEPGDVNENGNSAYWELGAAALSIKENVETGKNHGVYLRDDDGNVGSFLHKQSVDTLKNAGAVDNRGNVDIDTGAVILNADVLNDLYSLISTEESYYAFVNERARLSFYADFLYPLASSSTLESYYKETPEGEFTEELHTCREQLWKVLHKYRMKLIQFSPASFIHFGTTRELLRLMAGDSVEDRDKNESGSTDGTADKAAANVYSGGLSQYRFLDWKNVINGNLETDEYAISNSYVSRRATVGKGSYIEDSRIHRYTHVGKGCVISGATLTGETVPDHTVLHALKLNDGKFVCRMYGVCDNPKEAKIFGRDLSEMR